MNRKSFSGWLQWVYLNKNKDSINNIMKMMYWQMTPIDDLAEPLRFMCVHCRKFTDGCKCSENGTFLRAYQIKYMDNVSATQINL